MAAGDLTHSGGSSSRSWARCISGSFRELWSNPSDLFHSRGHDEDDEANLQRAALERLLGSRREFVPQKSVDDDAVDVATLGDLDKKILVEHFPQVVEEENERLPRLRKRMERLIFLLTI
ncbi:unnamed protein product [Spirodela intermedia]|uniref:Uncharacterized protein n=1 Tax=Spirodela intermedia TaxID=51605 RepID=A0A7I8JRE3_SPIIN|nr:unnamed protein product [Spirodela intermedia]CAA6672143.1 unnamed protein product [Spirodela intermedia]